MRTNFICSIQLQPAKSKLDPFQETSSSSYPVNQIPGFFFTCEVKYWFSENKKDGERIIEQGFVLVAVALVVGHCSDLSFISGFSASATHEPHTHHHGCSHMHHHDHGHGYQEKRLLATSKFPEAS
ncbi:hypothetical protein ACFX2A_010092 [Malus domestica]